MTLRFLELFAGADGFGAGFTAAGLVCVARAEVDAHARAVLRHRDPSTPLLGDVALIDADALAPLGRIDVVTGGSPCQGLSAAGEGRGLDDPRSALFHQQMRIWRLTEAPYCVWENVEGALWNRAGADFAAVLSTLVGAALPVPRDGWRGAGVAVGPDAVAAWRVLDLRYCGPGGYGPPQRRRRLFVVAARAGGADPAAILLEPESVCRHPSPRAGAGARTAKGARGRTDQSGRAGVMPFDTTQITSKDNRSRVDVGAEVHTMAGAAHPPSIAYSETGYARWETLGDGSQGTIAAHEAKNGQHLTIGFHHTQTPIDSPESVPALGGTTDGMGIVNGAAPRRLMPLECERVQGWADNATRYGVNASGKLYEISDAQRYHMIGNGCGSPQSEWIGRRLLWALDML